MSLVRSLARRFAARPPLSPAGRNGSTAIEYTIIAGLLSMAIVASLGQIAVPLMDLLADGGPRFDAK